jgi:hypothetical protein
MIFLIFNYSPRATTRFATARKATSVGLYSKGAGFCQSNVAGDEEGMGLWLWAVPVPGGMYRFCTASVPGLSG